MSELERVSGMSDEEAGMLRLEMLASARDEAQVKLASILYHDELDEALRAVWAWTPRGMPNSEARKRLEEREASLACERCGHSGVGLFRMGQSTLCVSKPACDARLSAAQACLKPVTQA